MHNLRNVKIDDLKDIIEINEESIPAVNTVSLMQFKSFLRDSIYFKVVTNHSQKICGFLLVLPSGLEYDSLNYKWFSSRYEKFAYIDRIAISKNWRNKGMGKSLYTDLENTLKDYNLIACEFNVIPLNLVSKQFHESLDYENVGFQLTENGTKKVSLMTKKII
ncbi:GNAT family N-acetyltransferase [Pelagibacteraceae bacterium]|nr:GNAT family N-acetyltransferase [Pelagibacteraceae bacterium]